MILLKLTKISCGLTLLLTTAMLSACGSNNQQTTPMWEEAPIIEAPWVPPAEDNWHFEENDINTIPVVYVVLPDFYPLPLGEWFSVRHGVFMRSTVGYDEVFLSIQNQATFSHIESILVLSYEGKDIYAFLIPASLIPPFDFQTDYVARSNEALSNVDEFRVVVAGDAEWGDLLFLAEHTETQRFIRLDDGQRGVFRGVHQTRHRYTFYDLDFSILNPEIRWTPRYVGATTGYMDLPLDGTMHPSGLGQHPPNVTQVIGNQSMYDLNLQPVINHAGLRFSDLAFSNLTMSFEGIVENVSNQGVTQTVSFELMDENWESLGTISFGPGIPAVGSEDSFRLNASPSMTRTRFIRVVG